LKKCVYPGSFDPISNGHLDIIKRAAKLFDEVHVLVSYNMFKKTAFSKDERIELIKLATSNLTNVIVTAYDGLVVNYCKENQINIIIRGMRNYSDYENEFQLFQYNKDINPNVETVILLPSSKNQFISSSAIKELVTFGLDISKYVPKAIVDKVTEKLK
jgi:pantetheine-phosphate adenylyltransferase